jgi:hypothetical protein
MKKKGKNVELGLAKKACMGWNDFFYLV